MHLIDEWVGETVSIVWPKNKCVEAMLLTVKIVPQAHSDGGCYRHPVSCSLSIWGHPGSHEFSHSLPYLRPSTNLVYPSQLSVLRVPEVKFFYVNKHLPWLGIEPETSVFQCTVLTTTPPAQSLWKHERYYVYRMCKCVCCILCMLVWVTLVQSVSSGFLSSPQSSTSFLCHLLLVSSSSKNSLKEISGRIRLLGCCYMHRCYSCCIRC